MDTTDLFYTEDAEPAKPLKKVYSITELSMHLKGVVENHFTGIQVQAELSSVKRHSSGHIYFALKDDQAVLDGVCWRGSASKLTIQPQDGLEVICTGRLTTYPGRSKYQMVVDSMELAGQGALLQKLEALKQKLMAEGLFEQHHKKPIPFLPRRIGVITSPTGAVIRDILHRLDDRFPLPVTLWPVPVQGDAAVPKIVAALKGFETLSAEDKPDVLILARGGGSLEDLWCFHDERVVRAVFECSIPIITAVGHETDTTLVDYAADLRAPTPTAAAEHAVPVRSELLIQIQDRYRRMNQSMRRFFEDRSQRLDESDSRQERAMQVVLTYAEQNLSRLQIRSPQDLIDRLKERSNNLSQRLDHNAQIVLDRRASTFETASKLLESYSFKKTIERGFAVIRSSSGTIVQSVTDTAVDSEISLTLKDGDLTAVIQTVNP